jgi:hypothetical protein
MIPKPTEVKAITPYIIWLKFADGTEGQIDLSHLINKPVFKRWEIPSFFNTVYIDIETFAIAWDENIELCPDNLYLKIKGLSFEQWKSNQYSYATNK